jgi:hypothetical protein
MVGLLAHLTALNLACLPYSKLSSKGDPASSCAAAQYSWEGIQNSHAMWDGGTIITVCVNVIHGKAWIEKHLSCI